MEDRLLRPLAGLALAAIAAAVLDAAVILSGLADTSTVWLGVLLLTVICFCFNAGVLATILAWLRGDAGWRIVLAALALVALYGRFIFDFAPSLRDALLSVVGIANGEIALDVFIPLPVAVAALLYAYTALNVTQPRAATASPQPES